MSHLVLVHGAWHGGWCWERVTGLFAEAGHTTACPTLKGLAERSGELTPEVGLRDHVTDVLGAIDAAPEGEPIVVVGHSYAGIVVREAADRRPERVSRVVLLDGWVAPNGKGLFDVAPDWFVDGLTGSAQRDGDGWRIPAPDPALFGVTEPSDVEWVRPRVTDHPLRTFQDPTTLGAAVADVPGSAIVCRPGAGIPFEQLATEVGYEVLDIETGHDAMVTKPQELARLLDQLA